MSDKENPEKTQETAQNTNQSSSGTGPSRDRYRSDRGDRDRSRDRDYNKDDQDDRSDYRQSSRSRQKVYFKRKVCRFCTQNVPLDYKDPETLWRFLTARGKILPRRITGTCAKHQRALAKHVKRARNLAFIPFVKQ